MKPKAEKAVEPLEKTLCKSADCASTLPRKGEMPASLLH